MGQHLGWVLQNAPSNIPEYLKVCSTHRAVTLPNVLDVWLTRDQFQYVDGLSYAPDIALLKTSILCLYIRLFGIQKSFRRICYFQIAVVTLWAVVADLVFIFQCNPVGITWSIDRNQADCFDVRRFWYSVSAINVVTDLGLLVTPLPALLSLKLSLEKWTYIATILALGLMYVLNSLHLEANNLLSWLTLVLETSR